MTQKLNTEQGAIVHVDKNGYLNLDVFADFVDITKVEYYSMETCDDSFKITFYDKDKKKI